MSFIAGSLIGGIIAFVIALAGQYGIEKQAVDTKIIKLQGKIYEITELEKRL